MRVYAHDCAGKDSLDSNFEPLICSILTPAQVLWPALSLIYLPAGFYFGDKIAALLGVGIWGDTPPQKSVYFDQNSRSSEGWHQQTNSKIKTKLKLKK